MPDWYQEISKELKRPVKLTPEKKVIIDFLKQKIKELEGC